MGIDEDLERYLDRLADVLGHLDRRVGLKDYCRGLMLPIKRKSVEPLAAHVDPCKPSTSRCITLSLSRRGRMRPYSEKSGPLLNRS